jgi:hypothetical protein
MVIRVFLSRILIRLENDTLKLSVSGHLPPAPEQL